MVTGRAARAGAAPGAHGFPAALSSFVGRTDDVAEVARLLDEFRLVTVTGPGGVGKTRLAGQVARQVAGSFADGAWLIELAALLEPDQVPAAVVAALGMQQAPAVPGVESLAALLARRQLLLVLDNCEHVAAAVAELCGSLLQAADDVSVLATSREPLHLPGEARYRLSPLDLPPPGDLAAISTSGAVRLFAERARQADHRFRLAADTAPAVARVVRRLDGMPLAIELAAARAGSLEVDQLADRLDDPVTMASADRLGLLTGADRLAADRQRSLTATAQWSYDLLPEPEREVFRKLSAFPGPFTLEAAEQIAGPAAGPAVLHLVDCSLLVPPQVGADGRPRYALLETLRGYAAQQLAEAGEEPDAAAALARFALGMAERAAAGLASSTGELDAARWLDAEDATVHRALGWALEHDPGTALALAIALAPWWELRGRFARGHALLSRAVPHAAAGSAAWCEAQLWLGSLDRFTSITGGLAVFTAVRDALADQPPSPHLVRALNERAGCLIRTGELSQATEDAGRALAMARDLGYPAGQARALYFLGAAAAWGGDVEKGVSWSRQTQQIDPAAMTGSLARRCAIGLTVALMEAGEVTEARAACARGLALARQTGGLVDLATCLMVMTDLELRAGQLPQARGHLREAVELESRLSVPLILADCLDWCGHLCARTQRWADALTAWAAQARLQQLAGKPQEPLPDTLRREEPQRKARQALGPGQAAAAEQRGASMESATAAEFALLLTAAPEQDGRAGPDVPGLSGREQELVTLVARGRTDAQIASQLYISIRTVRSHLDRIRDKTGCRRRADLTRLALQAQLV